MGSVLNSQLVPVSNFLKKLQADVPDLEAKGALLSSQTNFKLVGVHLYLHSFEQHNMQISNNSLTPCEVTPTPQKILKNHN